jgi:hypothetical protein
MAPGRLARHSSPHPVGEVREGRPQGRHDAPCLDRQAAGGAADGVAQEFERVWVSDRRQTRTAAPQVIFARADRRVTCYYFYLRCGVRPPPQPGRAQARVGGCSRRILQAGQGTVPRARPLSGSRTRPLPRTGGGPRACGLAIPGSRPWSAPCAAARRFFTSGTESTGSGLAVVRMIAEAHGGRVRAENTPAGGARVPSMSPPTEPTQAGARAESAGQDREQDVRPLRGVAVDLELAAHRPGARPSTRSQSALVRLCTVMAAAARPVAR